MKKKTIVTAVLTMAMAFGFSMNVAAADTNTNVSFTGDAGKFIKVSGDSETDGFGQMDPGETNTVNLTLTNDSSNEMKFYISADLLQDIAQQGASKTAVYTFDIKKNGAATPFFQAEISGGAKTDAGTDNVSIGKEYMTDNNNILLDTLKKGESSQVAISLGLDGSSTGDDYQGTTGQIQFVLSAETPDTPAPSNIVKKVVNYVQGAGTNVVKTVKTGDILPLGIMAAALISLIAIAVVLVKRRKSRTEEER